MFAVADLKISSVIQAKRVPFTERNPQPVQPAARAADMLSASSSNAASFSAIC